MAGALTSPPQWRRFRRRQPWLALFFLVLALLGFFSAAGGYTPGLVLVLLSGPLAILSLLNARNGRRGGRMARQVERRGVTCLEFPGHRLAVVLLLVVATIALAATALLFAVSAWQAMQGSLRTGWNAVIAGAVTVVALYGMWVYRPPRAHRGWPAVRLGAEGVEFTSPFDAWLVPWNTWPVPSVKRPRFDAAAV